MPSMLMFLLFCINSYAVTWQLNDFKGTVIIYDTKDNSSMNLSRSLKILDSSMLLVKDASSVSLTDDKTDFFVDIEKPSLIAFSEYKNFSAHIYLIKGEAEFFNNSKERVFTIETSTTNFILQADTKLSLISKEYADAYKVTATVLKGTLVAYNVNGKKLTTMTGGDSFIFWKGRFIETLSKAATKKELDIGKKELLKEELKEESKPEPIAKPKAMLVGDIEKELFGKIQSNDEFKKVLLKGVKDKDYEESVCGSCALNARIAFRVPESINLVSTNVFPDKYLPAVFYKTKEGKFINEIYSNYKLYSEDTSGFVYEIPEGVYYVTILSGMPFKVSVKAKTFYYYNVSAFINPTHEVEVISPLSKDERYLSIKGSETPFFLYPGVYEFVIKDENSNDIVKKKIEIKAGSVNFVEL